MVFFSHGAFDLIYSTRYDISPVEQAPYTLEELLAIESCCQRETHSWYHGH